MQNLIKKYHYEDKKQWFIYLAYDFKKSICSNLFSITSNINKIKLNYKKYESFTICNDKHHTIYFLIDNLVISIPFNWMLLSCLSDQVLILYGVEFDKGIYSIEWHT